MENKTAEEILKSKRWFSPENSILTESEFRQAIEAMEEYAAQSKQQASAGWSDEEIDRMADEQYKPVPEDQFDDTYDTYPEYLGELEYRKSHWIHGFKAALQSSQGEWKKEQQEQCRHEWVGYERCCYCGVFKNAKGEIKQ